MNGPLKLTTTQHQIYQNMTQYFYIFDKVKTYSTTIQYCFTILKYFKINTKKSLLRN